MQMAESTLARFSERGCYRLSAPHGISGRQRTQPGPSTARNEATETPHCASGHSSRSHCCSSHLARGARCGTVDIPVAVPENPRASASMLARVGSSCAGCPPLALPSHILPLWTGLAVPKPGWLESTPKASGKGFLPASQPPWWGRSWKEREWATSLQATIPGNSLPS